jgi:hypothetical protein
MEYSTVVDVRGLGQVKFHETSWDLAMLRLE